MTEKLGIDKVERVTKHLVDLCKEGAKAYKDDGKISSGEWFGMIDEFIPLLTDLTQARVILAQIKDFDTEEGRKYAQYIISLGIVPEKAQRLAQLTVGYVDYQIQGYELYLKEIIEEVKDLKN